MPRRESRELKRGQGRQEAGGLQGPGGLGKGPGTRQCLPSLGAGKSLALGAQPVSVCNRTPSLIASSVSSELRPLGKEGGVLWGPNEQPHVQMAMKYPRGMCRACQ